MTTSQGDDGVGTSERPEHAGLFEARADHGLAARLDHTGANEEVLAAERGIAHAVCLRLEVIRLDTDLLDDFGVGGMDGAKRAHQLFDLAFVEQATLMELDPSLLVHFVVGKQLASQLPQVLARVI